MSNPPNFARAVDLSSLGKPKAAPTEPMPGSEVTAANLTSQFLPLSHKKPVIVIAWSARSPESMEMVKLLGSLESTYQGSWALGRLDVDAEPNVAQALQTVTSQVSTGKASGGEASVSQVVALEPAAPPKQKRRKPQRRITKAQDGRVEVSAPEMNMLKCLPLDGSPMNLPKLAEAVWPGRKAPNGGPLVGPAARVAGGLRAKSLATIEGIGGDKTVSVDTDWKTKAVEVQK